MIELLKILRDWIATAWRTLTGTNSTASPATVSKFPSNLQPDLCKLGQALIREHQEVHGHFCTKTRFAASTIQDLAIRERVQADLDHTVGLFCAAHVMAVFEEALPEKHWADIYESDDLQTLKGLRHIRRCTANGFRGRRATEDAAEFDAVMNSSQPFRGVESFDADNIRLTELIGSNSIPILQDLTNKALVTVVHG